MLFNKCFPTFVDYHMYTNEPDGMYTLDHQMLHINNRLILSVLWIILMVISPAINILLGHMSLFVPGTTSQISDAYRESYSIFAGINSMDLLILDAKALLMSPLFWIMPVYFGFFAKLAYVKSGCNEYIRHINRIIFCIMALSSGLIASVVIIILVSYSAYVSGRYADQYLEGKGFKRSSNNSQS